ncbi:helix-turn-helix domain-containing protein [Tenacibaculum singaporense]|uniref:helix-turn-helix domain-containing protein n=1 Tax=Tenacibaculum singaporense TaxID=2358479 RepID=UPI000F672E85|nr:helix-turn-helix transcriptional regulator [Tenacibaculum singaporense]RSC96051.1 XRE family transcriptional regulator [Tenacibaculum singaporense]
MQNYNNSANIGSDFIFKYFKDRMKEKKITQKKLSEMIGVSESTLVRNFKKETEMLLTTYLKICGALELNPYLIPKEIDSTEFQRLFFN